MLYTNLRLKNYKVFNDISFSLLSKKNVPKHLAIIYGANGSGKSTILEAFAILDDLMNTKDISNTFDYLKDKMQKKNSLDIDDYEEISKYISRGTTSIEQIYENIKGTDSSSPTSLILDFIHDGNKGTYEIRLYDKCIVYEELHYRLNKNRGCYYRIDNDKAYINNSIINDKTTLVRIKELYKQYWGIHSFFSIIKNEIKNYNPTHIKKAFLENFIILLNSFNNFNYRINNSSITINGLSKSSSYLLSHIIRGNLENTSLDELKKTEKDLTNILKPYIDDLISIKYVIQDNKYKLYLNKHINNTNQRISYASESSGIREIIDLVPYILRLMNEENVIIDEYANHIHDLSALKLLNGIIPYINGQLIISTHSTILLSQLDDNYRESFYFIKVKNTTRTIKCITEIEQRLRNDNNYQKKYLYDSVYENYRN